MSDLFSDLVDKKRSQQEFANIYSISPSLPFLKTFSNALIHGELIKGFKPIDDPLSLSDATIYLPTRRAARGLAAELLQAMQKHSGAGAILLPKIRTIGDLDEEEKLFGLTADMPIDIGSMIQTHQRQLILARLTKQWSDMLNSDQRELFEMEDIVLPSSAADAIRLASNLASFMDQVETEEVNWQTLQEINDDEFQQWWQITLTFLKIIMEIWPAHLTAIARINPAEFRTRHTNFRISQLESEGKKGPIIAAGSTGSIPATARLISEIAKLENGAVILPGVNHDLPPDVFSLITKSEEDAVGSAYSTHPQFGLSRLLTHLKCRPLDVAPLGAADAKGRLREKIINIAMLPPEKCADWSMIRRDFNEERIQRSFENVSIVNAAGERQEALSIALLFRQALEENDKTAALITPDRNLARRVATELERYGILVDDSGGSPLSMTAPALFFKQLLQVIFGVPNAVTLSSFLKNDFLLVGMEKSRAHYLAELVELLVIREVSILPDISQLHKFVERALAKLDGENYAPVILKRLNEETHQELLAFAAAIESACKPILAASQNSPLHVNEVLNAAHLATISLNLDSEKKSTLYKSTIGELLSEFIKNYDDVDCSNFPLEAYDVVPVIEALLSENRIRNAERNHPRLHIYGPLEARLQSSDLTILGGLNEGTWPQVSGNDPFLNRPMRASLGLPLPERRIGLSAHDFQQFMGNEEIVLTRSNRVDDAPSVASRWVQRLTTFLGKTQSEQITQRGNRLLDLVDRLDQSQAETPEILRPAPTPPVHLRPTSLSITEIEVWIRDPYAIYAKHVLGLYPLPKLIRTSDAALKGNLYHEIIGDFIAEWNGPITQTANDRFFRIADEKFEALSLAEEVKSVWRARFDNVAKDFLAHEQNQVEKIVESVSEVIVFEGDSKGAGVDDTGFTLKGRADRINILKDGTLEVLDYKTSANPSAKMARSLVPQLSLEGALAQYGKFENIAQAKVCKLAYVRLQENAFRDEDISNKNHSVEQIIEDAWVKLKEQILAYQSPEQPFISRRAPRSDLDKSGDYDHLARVREWSLEDDAEGFDG